jgi:hypothetical protein
VVGKDAPDRLNRRLLGLHVELGHDIGGVALLDE